MRVIRSARILHLFDEVCTLVSERGETLSLVSSRIGPGPFAVVIDGDFTDGLALHQPATLDRARLNITIGPLTVDTRPATVWQPRPDWSRLRDADMARWPAPAALPTVVDDHLRNAAQGLADQDPARVTAAVAGLAGRGNGLTPTGDDVLVGLLFALWVWYPRRAARSRREWLAMIPRVVATRTTTLSANFIRAAAAGEAARPWHYLVSGRPDAVDHIRAMGASSGEEAWAGFLHTGAVLRAFALRQSPATDNV